MAIREAANDGNSATEADPAWTPLFDPATPRWLKGERESPIAGPPAEPARNPPSRVTDVVTAAVR